MAPPRRTSPTRAAPGLTHWTAAHTRRAGCTRKQAQGASLPRRADPARTAQAGPHPTAAGTAVGILGGGDRACGPVREPTRSESATRQAPETATPHHPHLPEVPGWERGAGPAAEPAHVRHHAVQPLRLKQSPVFMERAGRGGVCGGREQAGEGKGSGRRGAIHSSRQRAARPDTAAPRTPLRASARLPLPRTLARLQTLPGVHTADGEANPGERGGVGGWGVGGEKATQFRTEGLRGPQTQAGATGPTVAPALVPHHRQPSMQYYLVREMHAGHA